MFEQLTAIVLAAGRSRRAAPHNKLLLPFGDSTVVRSTVAAVCGADFGEVIVVTGHERERVEAALDGLDVRFVFAADFTGGMGHSLAAGVRATAEDVEGFAVTPGDLPSLTSEVVRQVTGRFDETGRKRHVIPRCNGRRGHPVILGSWIREELSALSGDSGARDLLNRPDERTRTVLLEMDDPAIWRDVDGRQGAVGQGR